MFNLKQALEQQTLIYLNQEIPAHALYIKENDQYRWLEINSTVHSVMSMQQPQKLVLPHLHAMMVALYLNPHIRSAVELGLGGGAIQRFIQFYCTFPITSIEYNDTIIDCFRHYFSGENQTQNVVCSDAQRHVQLLRDIDLLIVDLFAADGCPDFLLTQAFYQHCHQALSSQGMLVINLVLNNELQVALLCDELEQLFGHKPWCFSVPGYINRILTISIKPMLKFEFNQPFMNFVANHDIDLNAFTLDR